MGMEVVSGDIVELTDKAVLFAINGDPNNGIYIPKSVILEGDIDEPHDDEDLLVESWWYNKNVERFT